MDRSGNIPAMTPPEVHDYLREIGSQWTGQGCAMELGSWLGASAVPLLEGLVSAKYDLPFWAFDFWVPRHQQIIKAAEQGQIIKSVQNLMILFLKNALAVYQDVNAVKGRLPDTLMQYDKQPIEVCIFDAPKTNPVFIRSMKKLVPHFIPGVTVVGLLDFYSYQKEGGSEKKKAALNFINKYKENFTMIQDWPGLCSCAFFKYEKAISWKQ